ncbi:hypothetical protein [Oligella sp. HMSC09E12]|uniref:hypothetical protein n=1 Tax=Oligella sp. HMSC09E12 TaxID=1581147 RepID=UPI0008A25511|nr:hypothetical protein [Oligella sp. HMSC09E12]OFV50040.1 hypothetical protein HMPREF3179_02980 [Oligella sp. HMSC09E12]
MSGGGGGSKTQTSITKTEPADQVKPYLNPFMGHAAAIAMKPYETYGGNRIADWNQDQLAGFKMTRQVANQSQAANSKSINHLNNVMGGQYLNYSPGTNQYLGQTSNVGSNQYLGAQTNVGTNQYAGQNAYLNDAIKSAQDDVTRQFNNNVQNSTDAAMARQGAFGGSAWRQAQAANQEMLNRQHADISTGMRMQDYGMQQQLAEADINRRLQAEQTDLARNAGLSEADINRRLQAQQTDLARNAGLDQERLNMANSNYQAERQRQLQAAQLIPGMSQAGYQNAQALLGIGDAQQGMTQDHLNQAYADWLERQNWDQRGLDIMGSAIGQTMGAGGTTSSTGPNPHQRNRTASALGGALSGAAMGAKMGGVAGIPGSLIGGGLGLIGGLL